MPDGYSSIGAGSPGNPLPPLPNPVPPAPPRPGLSFDAEGGIRYNTADGKSGYIPSLPPPKIEWIWRSYIQVAQWADRYGREVPGREIDEAVKDFYRKRDWTAVDGGNLARIAQACEQSVAQLRHIQTNAAKIAKLVPRLERVLKLFEIVLKPVAEDVLRREAERDGR